MLFSRRENYQVSCSVSISSLTLARLWSWSSFEEHSILCKNLPHNNHTNKGVYHKEVFTFCEISHSRENKLLYVPAQQASNIDCIDMDTYQKLNTLSFDSDATQLGLLMSLHAVSANHLLAGYESGHIVLFDLRKSCEVSRINVFPGQPVMCLDYSREKNLGISGSAEHFMNEFGVNEVGTLELGAKLEITNPGLNCLKIRPSDSKIFVSGGWDKRVRVFGSKKRNLLAVLDFHKEAINTIEFSSGNLMAVGANDGIISFWDLYSWVLNEKKESDWHILKKYFIFQVN